MDSLIEEWRPINIPEYAGLYSVSNTGLVKGLKRGKILKPTLRGGYKSISLSKSFMVDGKCKNEHKTNNVHRLVALSFLDNPNSHPVINHIDGDKENNHASNLEWCTYKQNTAHAIDTKLARPSTKGVYQYSYDGKTLINTFSSIREAEKETNVGNKLISAVCRGQKKTAHKYRWVYVDDKWNIDVEIQDVVGVCIEDYPNYIICKTGQVYSKRLKRYMVPNSSTEYQSVKLCNNTVMRDFRIHILVANAYLTKHLSEKPLIVNHKNCNKHDNRVENLEYITYSENNIHSLTFRQATKNINENPASLLCI